MGKCALLSRICAPCFWKVLDVSDSAFHDLLRRLTNKSILKRATRGVYVYSRTAPKFYLLEWVASCLRQEHLNYVSLESTLSEYGVISQIPVGYVSVMTTGRSGWFNAIYGTIEFTHTARSREDILSSTMVQNYRNRPLRLAWLETALRDLRRVGRNVYMINMEYYQEILEDYLRACIERKDELPLETIKC